jgi:hypothetical protein
MDDRALALVPCLTADLILATLFAADELSDWLAGWGRPARGCAGFDRDTAVRLHAHRLLHADDAVAARLDRLAQRFAARTVACVRGSDVPDLARAVAHGECDGDRRGPEWLFALVTDPRPPVQALAERLRCRLQTAALRAWQTGAAVPADAGVA